MNKLSELTAREYARQRDTLNLIASENYPSPKTLALLGSVWSNKYAEGYPGKRYYAGNVNTDELESYVQELALKVFDCASDYGVNVQVLSGSPANAMVYLAMLEPDHTVLSASLDDGGHLSHLTPTSSFSKFFKSAKYSLKQTEPNTYEIDLDEYESKLKEHKPKLTIIGFSAYPRAYQFAEMCRLAHQAGSLVLADVAHINGLIAAGLHNSPFKAGVDGADFVSMTTHKTLRGPRGAMLFAKKTYIEAINKTVFPGTSGGPHMHQIAAVGQCLLEILGEDQYPDGINFKAYSQNVLDTAKALESGMAKAGLQIISPTQTHLNLVRLPDGLDSLEFQQTLEGIGIISNRNKIPGDTGTAWKPSGMRFGTSALASRGLNTVQAQEIGELIGNLVSGKVQPAAARPLVDKLAHSLNWYYPAP